MVMNIPIREKHAAAVGTNMGTNIIITKIHASAGMNSLHMNKVGLMKKPWRLCLRNRNQAKAGSRKK